MRCRPNSQLVADGHMDGQLHKQRQLKATPHPMLTNIHVFLATRAQGVIKRTRYRFPQISASPSCDLLSACVRYFASRHGNYRPLESSLTFFDPNTGFSYRLPRAFYYSQSKLFIGVAAICSCLVSSLCLNQMTCAESEAERVRAMKEKGLEDNDFEVRVSLDSRK